MSTIETGLPSWLILDTTIQSSWNVSTSAGGPGCSPKCVASEDRKNTSYRAGFYTETHNWPKGLLQNMHLAADILKRYGSPYSLDTERRIYLHIAFDYYCCYTTEESSMCV